MTNRHGALVTRARPGDAGETATQADAPAPGVVHIIDDDQAIRRSLTMLAEAAGHAVRSHADAESFLRRFDPDAAGCVVTDVRMPGLGGLELLKRLGDIAPELPVVVITGHGDVPMAVTALKAGAADFIEKPFDSDAFLRAVREALRRRAVAGEGRRLLAALRTRRALLTDRERAVMDLVAEGSSNAETAARLEISIRTVENHRAKVMEKMEARTLSDLVRMALRLSMAG
ncbi:MAG: response regulator transcription factor [Proteobacteria bacterium]|nr:response regulator transcription factor [Pseudomonadota bacterium]